MKFSPPPPSRLQVLRRTRRIRHRTRPDRHRRAERLRQVEPCRGAALGDGRKLLQEHARVRHGRRDLFRLRHAPGPQHRRSRRSSSTIPTAPRRPPSTMPTNCRCRAASSARPARVYRINGKEARAKDVQLLFADQSTGARSPSMVGQGRIGELIQAKPQARRALLEEAAGISGLHTRRHEAELRLQGGRAESRTAGRRRRRAGKPDREPEAPGAPGHPLQEPVGRHPQGRGDAAASALDAGQDAGRRGALGAGDRHLAGRRARRRADGRGQGAGDRRAPPAGTARGGGRRRRRLPAPVDRQDAARGGGRPHPRRARPNSTAACSSSTPTSRARSAWCATMPTFSSACATEEATLNAENDGAAEREAATRAALRAGGGDAGAERGGARRADRRARRGRRLAQPDRARAARNRRAPRPACAPAGRGRPRTVGHSLAHRRPCRSGRKADAGRAGAGRAGGSRGWRRRRPSRRSPRRAPPRAAARPPLQDAQGRTGADRDRSAHAGQDAERGQRRPLPRRARADQRRARLRDGAGRRARRRSRRAARPQRAGALGRQRDPAPATRPCRKACRASPRVVRAPAQLAAPPGADRHRRGRRRPRGCRRCWRPASGWSAARARCGAGTASSPAPTRRRPPRSGWRRRTGWPNSRPKRCRRRDVLREAEEALAQAEAGAAPGERGRARRAPGLARRPACGWTRPATRWPQAEKAAGELSSRRAALDEARARIADSHEETAAAFVEAENAAAGRARSRRPASAGSTSRGQTVARDRAALADARAVHDGLQREAEARTRRLEAIGAERSNWLSARRKRRGADRIAGRAQGRGRGRARTAGRRARRDRRQAPARCCRSCPKAEAARKAAADRLQEAENRQAVLDKAATAAIQALAEAREARGRAEERLTAADERRHGGRGAHPGSAEHAAASGHPPHRPGSRRARCPTWPRSSASSSG